MYKEATDKQVELCKLAAIDRFKQYGLPEVTGAQLYTAFMDKLAQVKKQDGFDIAEKATERQEGTGKAVQSGYLVDLLKRLFVKG